jgi:hypothetical protein
VRIPWGTTTVSDATKLQLRSSWTPHRDTTGETIYELMHQPVLTENFADLSAWTEVDAGGLVNLSGGVVSMKGNGNNNANGIFYTAGITVAEGVFEFKATGTIKALADFMGLSLTAALEATAGGAVFRRFGACALWAQVYNGNGQAGIGQITSASNWLTMRVYLLKNRAGLIRHLKMTCEGGTGTNAFPTETVILDAPVTANFLGATIYPMFQRVAADAELTSIKELRWCSGYATDGPYLSYVADAGLGRAFEGLAFANLAPKTGIATTNQKFRYSFDDGVAAFSGWYTLAQLNALPALPTRCRYIRLNVQLNSDGATQNFGAEMNADDATGGDSAPAPTHGLGRRIRIG